MSSQGGGRGGGNRYFRMGQLAKERDRQRRGRPPASETNSSQPPHPQPSASQPPLSQPFASQADCGFRFIPTPRSTPSSSQPGVFQPPHPSHGFTQQRVPREEAADDYADDDDQARLDPEYLDEMFQHDPPFDDRFEGEDVDEGEAEVEAEGGSSGPRVHGLDRCTWKYDGQGRVILDPDNTKTWMPKQAGVEKLVDIMKKDFVGPWKSWGKIPEDRRDRWFNSWKKKVTWPRRADEKMRKAFEHVGTKRLSGMLRRHRLNGTRPDWIIPDHWDMLLEEWAKDEYKALQKQNKTNRASKRGGALHTTGRAPHHEIGEQMTDELGRPVEPDELFLITHTKKNGMLIEPRSSETLDAYRRNIEQIQSQDPDALQGEDRMGILLQQWGRSSGGRNRGRVYGAADLSTQIHPGSNSFTVESRARSRASSDDQSQQVPAEILQKIREEVTQDIRQEMQISMEQQLKAQEERFRQQHEEWQRQNLRHYEEMQLRFESHMDMFVAQYGREDAGGTSRQGAGGTSRQQSSSRRPGTHPSRPPLQRPADYDPSLDEESVPDRPQAPCGGRHRH